MKLPWGRGGTPAHAADWLVVGLGNPGERYARTRHNAGYRAVNELSRRAGVQPKVSGKTIAVAVGEIAGARVALVKPRTFMNNSGVAVAHALRTVGCGIDRLVVVYDDLDLAAGALRLRKGGGHGGNNGLKSIAGQVGPDFIRVRVGIGRPTDGGEPSWDPDLVSDWVLSPPGPEHDALLREATTLACDAVEAIIREGVDVAGSRFNRR